MKQKLLFFDIDGTLVNFETQMPASAKTALRAAQEKGHKLFLCTGRGKSQIYPFLLDFGFDGIIAGAGAYVEYNGKILFHKTFGIKRIQKLMDLFTKHDMAYMLQMTQGCVLTHRGMIRFVQSLGFDVHMDQSEEVRKIIEKSLGTVILDDDVDAFPKKYEHTENVLYTNSPLSYTDIQKELGTDLKVTPPSFGQPKKDQGEITISGVSKGWAIKKTAEAVGVDISDTVAFGDGANDINMLEAAGTGVAMGNAVPEVKQVADFVTKDINDNGLNYAMKKLLLI